MKGSEKMVESWSKGKGWREALEDGLYKQQIAKREDLQKERMLRLAQVEDFQFDDLGDELRAGLKELEDGMTVTQRARLFADKMSGGTYSDDISPGTPSSAPPPAAAAEGSGLFPTPSNIRASREPSTWRSVETIVVCGVPPTFSEIMRGPGRATIRISASRAIFWARPSD